MPSQGGEGEGWEGRQATTLRTRAIRDAGAVIAAIARLALLERPIGDAHRDKLDENEYR